MAKDNFSCKCKNCGKRIMSKDAYWLFLDIDKKVYCCDKECADKYLQELNKVRAEKEMWDTLYKFVKLDVLHYKTEQRLSKQLVQRLQDLRNGTTIEKYIGRVQLSKEGYPYEVILKTFQKCNNDIQQSFRVKSFENERQQINYMMAIVENNINDIYSAYLRDIELSKIEQKEIPIDMEMQFEVPVSTVKNKAVDMSEFLDD